MIRDSVEITEEDSGEDALVLSARKRALVQKETNKNEKTEREGSKESLLFFC